MVERGKDLSFALESCEPIGIGGEQFRQHLQCDLALELRVLGAIDLAHAARANEVDDFVGPNTGTRIQCNGSGRIISAPGTVPGRTEVPMF